MQEADTIQVLGRGTSVDFTIDDSVPFEIAERSLREYLDVCRGLYSSGTVSVNVGRRILAPDQLSAIKKILDRETGLTVSRYWCAPETLQRALYGRSTGGGGGSRAPDPAPESTYSWPETEASHVAASQDFAESRYVAEGRQLSFDFMGPHSQPVQDHVPQPGPEITLGDSQGQQRVEVDAGEGGTFAEAVLFRRRGRRGNAGSRRGRLARPS